MISILRSNQPIALILVPLTILAGVIAQVIWKDMPPASAAIHGIGCLCVSLFCHRLYVKRNFVERGDPALAWLVSAWLVVMISSENPGVSIRSWLSLIFVCWSADHVLQIHRQPSTSDLQFRSGTLAAVAVAIQPLNAAYVIGLMVLQIIVRPVIIREWLMLFIGIIWGFLISYSLSISIPFWEGPAAEPSSLAFTTNMWIGLALLTIWGLIQLTRETNGTGLKTRNTRGYVTLLLLMTAGGSLLFFFLHDIPGVPNLVSKFHSLSWEHALKLTGITLGFSTVSLIPKFEGRKKKSNTFEFIQFLLLVGMMLVLFGFNLSS